MRRGGVQKLRTLIIQLAVQGKLVESGVSTDAACDLLDRVSKIKRELVTDKKLPRERPYPKVDANELPKEKPSNWAWPRFGEVWQLISGRDLAKSQYNEKSQGIPYITGASNIASGSLIINRWTEHPVVISRINDLLITCKGTIGTIAINAVGDLHIARQIMAIRDFSNLMNRSFLKIWLESYVIFLVEKSKSLIPGFSREDLIYAIFPLPPLEEQSRIVAKVDELMALCDQLEAQQQQKRQLQNQLRQATIQAVASATSPFELKQHWHRVQENFEQLFSLPEDVVDFKGMVLDLAVSGKLLSPDQYAKNITGSDLLKSIDLARKEWAENSVGQELKEAKTMLTKLRKQKVYLPEEKLPDHWIWVTFLQVSMAVVDCHNKTAPYVENGIHLVRTTDIRNGKMDLRNTKKITDETYDYWARRMPPQPGDIFFTREAPMGEAAIVPDGETVCLGQRTMLLRLFSKFVNNEFLLYAIRSPIFQQRMVEAAVGMTVKHLRVGGVEDLFVPLPPKQEQDLIVKTLDHFFSLCEKFEKQLEKENIISTNLAIASVALLTGINAPQEEEPLKTPQTELVAPVTLGLNKPNSKDAAPLATILTRQKGQMNANDLWQRFGGEVDAFYAQLKTEVAHGWLAEPAPAEMLEKEAS